MKHLIMQFNDFLIKWSGKIMMATGVLGLVINYNFDRWAGRSSDNYNWGWPQMTMFFYCICLIYVGWVFNGLMKIFKQDKED